MTSSVSPFQAQRSASTACFSVTAANDPATLPRVLGLFAKLGRTPHQCHATSFGVDAEELHIDLQYPHMTDSEAQHLARALRGCFLVKSVLTSHKQERMIA
ncbi:MAG: hypothetical protein HQ483_06490 [Rhodospirillales bacterium]|nr:hypothetical protein [Rhodospirillales bacterium]